MRTLCFLIALAVGSPHAHATSDQDVVQELATVQLPDPPMEAPPEEPIATARTERLQKALRCPVCQGLSVSDSPSDAARAMGDRIEELVREGYTEDQVTEYFVDRYGSWVELEPPSEEHRTLFLAPFVALVIGVLGLLVWARKRPSHAAAEADSFSKAAPTPMSDPSLEPWRARILAELNGDAK